jgi:hypothetical protein
VDLLRGEHLGRGDLPGVEDLAAQRQDGLELAAARLLGRAARRIALDQEQLGRLQVLARAVGQLAGEGGAADDSLALDLLAGPQARLGAVDGQPSDAVGVAGVLVQPQAAGVLGDAGDEGR